jgi:hypothetical protein
MSRMLSYFSEMMRSLACRSERTSRRRFSLREPSDDSDAKVSGSCSSCLDPFLKHTSLNLPADSIIRYSTRLFHRLPINPIRAFKFRFAATESGHTSAKASQNEESYRLSGSRERLLYIIAKYGEESPGLADFPYASRDALMLRTF